MCRWWAWGCQHQHEAGTTLSLARQHRSSCCCCRCYTSSLPQHFISKDTQEGATHSAVKSLPVRGRRYRIGFMLFFIHLHWVVNNAKKGLISVYAYADTDTEKIQILVGWPTTWSQTPWLMIKAGTLTFATWLSLVTGSHFCSSQWSQNIWNISIATI